MKIKKLLISSLLLSYAAIGMAQVDSSNTVEFFGFAQMDAGYNFGQVNPQWYDVMRPTKLPSFKDEFGTNGNMYYSVRQTRFGVKTSKQTEYGEFKTQFDFDLFGVGADAGLTTIRLRHAYGQLGHFGAGQTESPFMDLDVFPNTLDYWGPSGMLFYRNVQVRWMPIMGASHLVFALEQPGASADLGVTNEYVKSHNMASRFPLPDFSGHYRLAGNFGYVQLGGIARSMQWKDMSGGNLSGSAMGWGVSLSSNINIGKNDVLRLQGVYGEGIQNYFNDAPVDVAVKITTTATDTTIKGIALPVLGIVAFLDHSWSKKFTSSIGYSSTTITNSNGQAASAFKKGQYVVANLLYNPIPKVMVGIELQYIDRANYNDGFNSSATKVNFTFKYNFSAKFYGK